MMFNHEKQFQHNEFTEAKSVSRYTCITSVKELKHLERAMLTKDHLYWESEGKQWSLMLSSQIVYSNQSLLSCEFENPFP